MTSIAARDAAALLEIVREGAAADGDGPFPRRVLRLLSELIPSDAYVGYQEADVSRPRLRVLEVVDVVGEPPSPPIEDAYRALGAQNPHRCCANARERRVLRLSDYGPRRLRRLPYFQEVFRPLGIDDALRLWLPAPPGRARTIYLERSRTPYTDREHTLLTLLRPELVRIHAASDARRHAPAAGLTRRETEVLAQVRLGKTNREIAATLQIAPSTVRKHLENVFEKLGVRTRTAALARVAADAEARVGR